MKLRDKVNAWVIDYLGNTEDASNLTNLLMHDITASNNTKHRSSNRLNFMYGFMAGFGFLYLMLRFFA